MSSCKASLPKLDFVSKSTYRLDTSQAGLRFKEHVQALEQDMLWIFCQGEMQRNALFLLF
eukprot:CAMPEP_0197656878 /NCGR_PEP_ID=MMETSP1338-20131121/43805_1 /TAXON_ID=43686 ORGANISM="Pelagodinium beii, Strain RCC1491" /NCGR_SAMPLE_ID=MMETSP1338 /ASSEMBLY_ACC=CAM_ASM_000754 /LENGTH=59 /DNA_ID=CAMNT_0043233097 /DNA_START=10 /DNA_END=189 /DNA_ORIENTATION=+